MTFRWRADDGPTLNAGLVAFRIFRGSGPVLLRKPTSFFQDGGGGVSGPPAPFPSGSAHEIATFWLSR